MKKAKFWSLAAVTLTGLVLVGCGGGGGGGGGDASPPPSAGGGFVTGTDVTVAATTDSKSVIDLLKQIIADRTSDGTEPLVLGDAVLATSDNTEPEPI